MGIESHNARQIGKAFYDDVKAKVMRALVPDLTHLAARNPRAARLVEAQIEAVVEHAMKLLELAVMGEEPPRDDDSTSARTTTQIQPIRCRAAQRPGSPNVRINDDEEEDQDVPEGHRLLAGSQL